MKPSLKQTAILTAEIIWCCWQNGGLGKWSEEDRAFLGNSLTKDIPEYVTLCMHQLDCFQLTLPTSKSMHCMRFLQS